MPRSRRRSSVVALAATVVASAVLVAGSAGDAGAQSAVAQERNGLVTVEVESGRLTAADGWSWQPAAVPDAVGTALRADPNTGRNSLLRTTGPRVDLPIAFSTPGTYHVWVRLFGPTGNDDSVHVGLDGNAASLQGLGLGGTTTAGWVWFDQADARRVTVTVPSPGVHTLMVWAREDGVAVDRVVLARSSSFVPEGRGPTASPPPTGPTGAATTAPTSAPPVTMAPTTAPATTAPATTAPSTTAPSTTTASTTLPLTTTAPVTTAPVTSVAATVPASGGGTPVAVQETGGLVTFEVEHGAVANADGWGWERSALPAAVGTALVASPNSGRNTLLTTTGPRAAVPIAFSTPGTYHVWVRLFGPTGNDDSVHVGLDGSAASLQGLGLGGTTTAGWVWFDQADARRVTVTVPSPGVRTFMVWAREDGVAVDRVVLARSSSFVPQGTGPAASPLVPGTPPPTTVPPTTVPPTTVPPTTRVTSAPTTAPVTTAVPTTLAPVPPQPTGATASPLAGAARVRWTPVGGPVTAYVVDASPGGATISVSGTATEAVVSGLQNGTTYTFTVRAVNGAAAGPASSPSNPVVPVDPTAPTTTAPPTTVAPRTPTLAATSVVGGLTNPWDVAFAPDGTAVFTERWGRVAARRSDGSVVTLATGGDAALPRLFVGEQTGTTGLTLDPDFAVNRLLYVCVGERTADGAPLDARVARFRVLDGWAGLTDRTDVVTGIPLTTGRHSSCRPRFGPDGHLYVATGDAACGTCPQSPTSLGGKVLRVTRDGAPVAGSNPGTMDPRVFTRGHRNPMGLGFHPVTGQPFVSEHGPQGQDEVNALVAGANYGWDPAGAGGTYDGYGSQNSMNNPRVANVTLPVWTSGVNATIAPGGLTFVSGPSWGAWSGAVVVARLRGGFTVLVPDGAGWIVTEHTASVGGFGRLRSPVAAPDGSLWVTTDNGSGDRLVRVTAS